MLEPPVFSTHYLSSKSSFASLSLTSLAHLTSSASIYWRNSAGELPTGSEPSVTDPLAYVRLVEVPIISARSRANIEVGSFAGAAMPYQPATSSPGSASATAGLAGSAGKRLGAW